MSKSHKIPSAEVVPLADRMRYMQGFRFSLVPVVALVVWLSRDSLETSAAALALVTAVYLVVSVGAHVAWRASRRGGLVVFTAMLLADGVYLAWTSYATGSGASPLRYLIILHIIAVALLASYRTGLKMALWHSLLLLVVYYAQEGGLLQPLDPRDAPALGSPLEQLVVFSAVFWFVAIATSTFSAVNERELRRRRYDLEALASIAVRLEDQQDSASVAETLLDCVVDAFDFERTLFFGSKEDEELDRCSPTPATWRAGWSGRRPTSARSSGTPWPPARPSWCRGADVDNDALAERAGARRQEPRDRAALGRGPRDRRARGRARHAPRLAHRAPGGGHARALRLARRAGAAQRLAARAGPAAGGHRRPHRHRQPLHVPAGARARAGAGGARRRGRGPGHARHRSLQAPQRRLRPPGRRRGAARAWRPLSGPVRTLRHGRSLRRRGVRRDPARHRPRRDAGRSSSACGREVVRGGRAGRA